MSLGRSWQLLGSDCAQIGHHSARLSFWESFLVVEGRTLDEVGSSLITFGVAFVAIWMTWASNIDAAGDQADTAKSYETIGFAGFGSVGGESGGLEELWIGLLGVWMPFVCLARRLAGWAG